MTISAEFGLGKEKNGYSRRQYWRGQREAWRRQDDGRYDKDGSTNFLTDLKEAKDNVEKFRQNLGSEAQNLILISAKQNQNISQLLTYIRDLRDNNMSCSQSWLSIVSNKFEWE